MKRIRFTYLTITLLLIFSLTGCSFGKDKIDAGLYTKSYLDVLYKNQVSDYYLQYAGGDEASAKQAYEESLDADVDLLITGMEDEISDELKNKYRTMLAEIYKNMKYEVGTATENEDGTFTVPVTTYRLHAFAGTMEKAAEYYESLSSKKQEKMDETEDLELYEIDAVMDNLKNPEYDETTQTINITLAPVEGNSDYYGISSDDQLNLYVSMMDGSEWADEEEEETEGSD